jgi:hypothetical protein
MEKISDLYKNPVFQKFEKASLDLCQKICGSSDLARIKLEEIWRGAESEIYHRAERVQEIGLNASICAGIGVCVLALIAGAPKLALVGAVVTSLLGGLATGVYVKHLTSDKKIAVRAQEKLKKLSERPVEQPKTKKTKEANILAV